MGRIAPAIQSITWIFQQEMERNLELWKRRRRIQGQPVSRDPLWMQATIPSIWRSPLVSALVSPICRNNRHHQAISFTGSAEAEVQHLLDINAIEPVPTGQEGRGFYSILFLVQKSLGSWRGILDLKQLNTYIVYRCFKM